MLMSFEQTKGKKTQQGIAQKKTINEDTFQQLLKFYPEKALDLALENESIEHIRQAQKKGASLETTIYGATRLHKAVKSGNLPMVRLLYQMGAKVNATTYAKETPLLLALIHKQQNIADFLATLPGIDPTIASDKKQSPLKMAFRQNSLSLAITLMKNPSVDIKHSLPFFKEFVRANELNKVKAFLNVKEWLAKISSDERAQWLDEAIEKKCQLDVIQELFYIQNSLFNIPNAKIFHTKESFDTVEKINEFLEADDSLIYIEAHQLATPVAIAALNILQMKEDVKAVDKILEEYGEEENAMGDKKVKHANMYFEKTVEPYLHDSFLKHSRRRDKQQALLAVEKKIRTLIIDEILQRAEQENNDQIKRFIKKHKKGLILGSDSALKASVDVFTALTPEQAAWRGYNPHAPVQSDEWENLLTYCESEEIWKTDSATNVDVLDGKTASNTVRERVAYYYLAVMEGDDNDMQKRDRIVNFITRLADIRNAKGVNIPSCYPGTLTRIAQMGDFHDVVQLPPSFEEKLGEFMQSKVLTQFQAHCESLHSIEEKREFLKSLVDLNENSAADVIHDQTRYPSHLLTLRQAFIESLGNEMEVFDHVKAQVEWDVTDEELILVSHYFVDVARGKFAIMLEDFLERSLDSVPTIADIIAANPFKEDDKQAYDIAQAFIKSLQATMPLYFQSMRKLFNATSYLQLKMNTLHKENLNKEAVNALFEGLDGTEEAKYQARTLFLEECQNLGLHFNTAITNPYTQKLTMVNGQIKNTSHPQLLLRFQNMLPTIEAKQKIGEFYLAKLQPYFIKAKMDNEVCAQLLEELTEHLYEHDKLDVKVFEETFEDNKAIKDFLKLPEVKSVLAKVEKKIALRI